MICIKFNMICIKLHVICKQTSYDRYKRHMISNREGISFLYVPSYTTIYIEITQLRVTV